MKKMPPLLLLTLTTLANAQDPITLKTSTATPLQLDQSLLNEAHNAIQRAELWLINNQQTNGNWSIQQWPAVTGLALWALSLNDDPSQETLNTRNQAATFLANQAQENGAIYHPKGGLRNYNTALSMSGLYLNGDPNHTPIIHAARTYLARSQHKKSGPYYGGMGYDAQLERDYADLSNSYIAYEAMRLTQAVEDLRSTGPKADLDWQAAVQFLMQNQNLDNQKPWMHDDGGFVYHPAYYDTKGRISNKAGTFTNKNDTIKFRSYGSMTYAGLLGFIYAEVDRDDYRVRSALSWAINHWTLDENPGVGSEGLYYFYNVLSKGLNTMGYTILRLKDGRELNWRDHYIRKLIDLQKQENDGTGYWINEKQRYSEGDKTLVTAYTLIGLRYALPPTKINRLPSTPTSQAQEPPNEPKPSHQHYQSK